nr:histone deacetylase [Cryptomonas sp.]
MVFYYSDLTIGDFYYANEHPMKPFRITMVHDLVFSYGLHRYLEYKCPRKSTRQQFLNFHKSLLIDMLSFKQGSTKYLCKNFWKNQKIIQSKLDCPIFAGLLEYCEIYTGASVSAALELSNRKTKIVVNWAGGLHHAKRSESSGFCYINDIVLSLLELLRYFSKIFYIDIDIHHGDGVEEAFYLSNRVFSLSFHNYDQNYFPGSGSTNNQGREKGKYYSVNVPLKPGIDDNSFKFLFKPIVAQIVSDFNPDVIVLQCGADSLLGDKLGVFNLSIFAHGECVSFVKDFNLPMLILGGGGYSKKNVAECWTLETSILVGKNLSLDIPYNPYWEFYFTNKPAKNTIKFVPNKNSIKDLGIFKEKILNNIKKLKSASIYY